jgi:peptide methionine sulfoxide reductase MsrA
MRQLVLLNGCFWGSERVLSQIPGVKVQVGYAGGNLSPDPIPTYYNLSANGHAEAAHVWWEDAPGMLAAILEAACRKADSDPSPAASARYRRAVLCLSQEEADEVRGVLLQIGYGDMEVELADAFWPAEPYHQGYYLRTLGPP